MVSETNSLDLKRIFRSNTNTNYIPSSVATEKASTEAVYEKLGTPIVIITRGSIISANPQALKEYGLNSNQSDNLIGKTVAEVLNETGEKTNLFTLMFQTAKLLKSQAKNIQADPISIRIPIKIKGETVYRYAQLSFTQITDSDNKTEGLTIQLTDVTKQVEARKLAESQAIRDPLTGLLNRRGLAEIARENLSVLSRNDQPLVLVLTDLDNFKSVNDVHGHNIGDRLLVNTAASLAQSTRTSDLVSRIGGEEFLSYLPNTSMHQGFIVAERMRQAIANKSTPINEQDNISRTASFGITSCEKIPDDIDPEAFIEEQAGFADKALYVVKKQAGKNAVGVYIRPAEGNHYVAVFKQMDPQYNSIEVKIYNRKLIQNDEVGQTETEIFDSADNYNIYNIEKVPRQVTGKIPHKTNVLFSARVSKIVDGSIVEIGTFSEQRGFLFNDEYKTSQDYKNSNFDWLNVYFPTRVT